MANCNCCYAFTLHCSLKHGLFNYSWGQRGCCRTSRRHLATPSTPSGGVFMTCWTSQGERAGVWLCVCLFFLFAVCRAECKRPVSDGRSGSTSCVEGMKVEWSWAGGEAVAGTWCLVSICMGCSLQLLHQHSSEFYYPYWWNITPPP